jgi:hypothetical protein
MDSSSFLGTPVGISKDTLQLDIRVKLSNKCQGDVNNFSNKRVDYRSMAELWRF